MKRRALLAALGMGSLSGCTQLVSQLPEESDETNRPTETTESGGTGQNSGRGSNTESSSGNSEAIRDGTLSIHLEEWASKPKIRYYNSSERGLSKVSASNGAFYSVTIRAKNLSGSGINNLPSDGNFELATGGSTYEPIDNLPNDVSWNDVRQRQGTAHIDEPSDFPDGLSPGEAATLTLVFDAPNNSDFSVEWTHNNKYNEKVTKDLGPS
jgi:hypothetical protein